MLDEGFSRNEGMTYLQGQGKRDTSQNREKYVREQQAEYHSKATLSIVKYDDDDEK